MDRLSKTVILVRGAPNTPIKGVIKFERTHYLYARHNFRNPNHVPFSNQQYSKQGGK